jgi:hypothetical protein
MHDLAEYNLGLIAQKLGDGKAAKKYFGRVSAGKDKKLRMLARRRLQVLAVEQQRWRFYAGANFGYDDNITAAPSGTAQDESASFYDLFVSGDSVVGGRRKQGWIADASYFRIDYFDDDLYDEYIYGVGMRRENQFRSWDMRTHLGIKRSNYAGADFQSVVRLDVRSQRSLSRNQRLILRYIYEDINSDDPGYNYLQGWRQKARIEYRNYQTTHTAQAYYELELNDREDINLATFAASYSPTRHTLRGKYTHRLVGDWQVAADISYRVSDYPATFSQQRDDNRWRLILDTDYRLDETSKLRLRWQYTANSSTVEAYDYYKNVIFVGVSKLFL